MLVMDQMSSCRESAERLAQGACHGYIAQMSQLKGIFEDFVEEHQEAKQAA
jgi:hypothetical protein